MDQESHHDHHAKQGSLVSLAFGYPDAFSTHPGIQSFNSGNDLIPGMEMLGIPSKHPQNPDTWRDFFPSVGTSSATRDGFMVAPWQHDQHPPQGLSLALCNPLSPISRHGLFSESSNYNLDGRFFPPQPASTPSMGGVYMQEAQVLQSSRYLVPAQELLNEFCNLGGRSSSSSKHHKGHLQKKSEDGGSSSSWNQSLNSLDLMDLEKRKAKLLSMLEELERRYMKYREQMRAVVSSFEAMAGEGAAAVYSTLASKAMSRHFRCLRDGIVGQLNVTKKAMGDKEIAAQGTIMRGETPRLRLLDQCLRQQKAVHQAVVMENHPWRPQRGLPERSVSILRAWLFEHFLHPYPSDVDKHILARQTGLSRGQVSNWFINARVRLWKPMVEEIYLEETKEQDNQSPHASVDDDNNSRLSQLHANPNPNPNPKPNPNPSFSQIQVQDHKPAPGSLSSIISFRDGRQNFNAEGLEFSTFDNLGNRSFGGGVSLTLGLQQNYRGGMNMSFSREDVEDCQAENLPYRNLMGAQVMHDLAG